MSEPPSVIRERSVPVRRMGRGDVAFIKTSACASYSNQSKPTHYLIV